MIPGQANKVRTARSHYKVVASCNIVVLVLAIMQVLNSEGCVCGLKSEVGLLTGHYGIRINKCLNFNVN